MPQLLSRISEKKIPFITHNNYIPSIIKETFCCTSKSEKLIERKKILKGLNNDMIYVENIFYLFFDILVMSEKNEFKFFGKSYNVTNGESLPLWDVIKMCAVKIYKWKEEEFDDYVKNSKMDLPFYLAYNVAHLIEKVYYFAGIVKEPKLTRYHVSVMVTKILKKFFFFFF
jgi:hypothetical protein